MVNYYYYYFDQAFSYDNYIAVQEMKGEEL
jgi:hypothetical protein